MKNEFGLFKRGTSKVWYYWYYRGNKRFTKSTGKALKREAKEFVENQLKIETGKKKEPTLFKDFVKDFFVWDRCEWIEEQRDYDRPFSESVAKNRRIHVDKKLVPYFGDFYLHDIEREDIKKFLKTLKEYSNQTKNHILYSLRIILKYAEEKKYIDYINMEKLAFPLTKKHRNTRGILTLDQLKILFPESIADVWQDIKHGAMYYIMLSTGIRSGELRALTWEKYKDDGLLIDQGVKANGTIGETKTGNIRFVPLNTRARRYLEEWKAISPYTTQQDTIFYGQDNETPYSSRALSDFFGKRLDELEKKTDGLELKRKENNLCVHSLRHCFNTYMKTLLPQALLQALTGHDSDSMSKEYDHPSIQELSKRVEPARKVIEGVF